MRIAIAALAVLLLTAACSGEDITLTLDGPEETHVDEGAWYFADIEGATPVLSFVNWHAYVDLDDDTWPDANERLGNYHTGVDRLGNASINFWIYPEEFFGERDLELPDEMNVSVRAEVYWSDPVEGRVLRKASIQTIILTREIVSE